MKRVLLVGATDGIGRALALHYAETGWHVGVVGRDKVKVEAVAKIVASRSPHPAVGVVAGVTDPESVRRAFAEALNALGQLDLVIYCAGTMAAEQTPEDRAHAAASAFDVNAKGAVYWLEHAADYFATVGFGRLAAIGSVAGVRGRKGHPVYSASKAALHTYLEGMRHRLHGSGVGVSTVLPGWVRTRMLPAAAAGSRLAVDPQRAAALIAAGLERGRETFFVPGPWALGAFVIRCMPRWLFKRIAPP